MFLPIFTTVLRFFLSVGIQQIHRVDRATPVILSPARRIASSREEDIIPHTEDLEDRVGGPVDPGYLAVFANGDITGSRALALQTPNLVVRFGLHNGILVVLEQRNSAGPPYDGSEYLKGGLIIGDRVFPVGAVLSVPSYSIHRDPAMWGADVETFRPERWLGPAAGEGEAEWEARRDAMQRAFNPFSVGPKCMGRNLASLELQIIVASEYHFVLERPEQELQTRDGFLRKPLRCDVGIKRRDA
ncbi:cytochrome P450 [Mycena olivaceomarginata]|nr:cytochrome P450 [Mycena olivaceomarginata]